MLRLWDTTLRSSKRLFSNNEPFKYVLESLQNRILIRVTGSESKNFLQGLVTNDINHLGQPSGGSMFSMFLNTKGRILYDTVIYRTRNNDDTFLIECDREALEPLQKHLKTHRVRKKIDIISLQEEFTIHALFNRDNCIGDAFEAENPGHFAHLVVPSDKLNRLPGNFTSTITRGNLTIFKDPRVNELGFRIISKLGTDVKQEVSAEVGDIHDSTPFNNYRRFRYHLGVGEGVSELPPGNSFPLEANCDHLHGISFHKGCYIGQELTARTHHTGVVRKRLMPLYFTKVPTKLPLDGIISHENVNLGKLRGTDGNVGLALLRIAKALDFGEITIGNGLAKVKKPSWWPTEVSKEGLNIQKS